jgi:hypothetical protein
MTKKSLQVSLRFFESRANSTASIRSVGLVAEDARLLVVDQVVVLVPVMSIGVFSSAVIGLVAQNYIGRIAKVTWIYFLRVGQFGVEGLDVMNRCDAVEA